MCCFSGPVQSVSGTRIFARHSKRGKQVLAYAMKLSAASDVAMVLPLPVDRPLLGSALRFIDLSGYVDFFDDLNEGFPPPAATFGAFAVSGAPPPQKLVVQKVGAFDASFVPTVGDFGRLDERFRLPEGVWEQLPQVRDFGFAVFKLSAGTNQDVHPMAFEFHTRDPERLFFPTIHVHDGAVHAEASFAHALYAQTDRGELPGFVRTPGPARDFIDLDRAKGLVDGDLRLDLRSIWGRHENEDVWV